MSNCVTDNTILQVVLDLNLQISWICTMQWFPVCWTFWFALFQQSELHKDHFLPITHPAYKRVAKVANQLLKSNMEIPELQQRNWVVTVVDEPSVNNAFVLPVSHLSYLIFSLSNTMFTQACHNGLYNTEQALSLTCFVCRQVTYSSSLESWMCAPMMINCVWFLHMKFHMFFFLIW